jgi:hypothetical protein
VTPLDHLRHWFVGLDSDLQYEIAFALVPALVDDFKAQRFRSERGFTKALEAWLSPSRFTPRAIGKVVSATAFIDHAFDEVPPGDATERCLGSQPAQDKHLDHLEKALTRTVARASALIEQSRREVERSRGLLNNEARRDDGAPSPV